MVRLPLRTTTTFSAHSRTSGGRNMSFSHAARTAVSALWPNIAPGSDSHPIANHDYVNIADPQRVARRNRLIERRSTGE
jgi:hypothetical protein